MITKLLVLPEKNTIAINEHIRVDVVIDSGNQSVNVASGSLRYDPAILRVETITTGNSAINFWVTSPIANEKSGTIDFSGIIPGGITTPRGQLFSVVFSGIKSGQGTLVIENGEVYINDGNGTKSITESPKMNFVVTTTIADTNGYAISDTLPPEKFTITRTRDPNVFDGKWFVVFASQDKGSGIAQYQLCESFFKECKAVESPAVLESQSSFYAMRVKAYDQNGNMRTSTILSPGFIIVACLIGAIIAILVSYGVLKRKKIFTR